MKLWTLLLAAFLLCPASQGALSYPNCPGAWQTHYKAAAGAKATITKTAVTGKKLVLTRWSAVEATNSAAQGPIHILMKEGGTEVAAWPCSAPATGICGYGEQNIEHVVPASSDLTLEFSTTPVDSFSLQAVNLEGCLVPAN